MSDRDSPPPLIDEDQTESDEQKAVQSKDAKSKKEKAEEDSDDNDNGKSESAEEDGKSGIAKKSSYYFFASTPAEEAAKYAPKPIDPAAATGPYTAPAPQPVAAGASAWNAAGTWEDRDVSSWAQSRLKELIKGIEGPSSDSASAKITSVSKVEGDATILYVRGKKKIGYDLHINATWKGECDGNKIEGTVEIPSLEDGTSDEDLEIRVTVSTSGDGADKCRAVMKKAIPDIRKKVNQFVDELKKK